MPSIAEQLPDSWRTALADELAQPYLTELADYVAKERASATVFPPECDVFAAFHATPFDQVRVVLLGQDPYHDDGQAHGLCFSVRGNTKRPPSLQNMFRELHDDIGCPMPATNDLTPWAQQGVLMLNAVLTVRAHQAGSHRNRGWERFTDAVLQRLNACDRQLVFALWGKYARKKASLVDRTRHTVLEGAHPSPLSAYKGFFGSKPFSAINQGLAAVRETPIDWRIP